MPQGSIYAVSANQASQGVSVLGSLFTDIAGGAIHIGSSGFPHWLIAPDPSTPLEQQDRAFHIADNHMHDIPTVFHGAIAGVFAGYVADSMIEHNTIERASYTGISKGRLYIICTQRRNFTDKSNFGRYWVGLGSEKLLAQQYCFA